MYFSGFFYRAMHLTPSLCQRTTNFRPSTDDEIIVYVKENNLMQGITIAYSQSVEYMPQDCRVSNLRMHRPTMHALAMRQRLGVYPFTE